jgi:pilus assembly protein CpaB
VLSVGTQVQRGPDNQPIQAPVVTLEVTPDEAERLAIAQRAGAIQLVLRGYGDPDSTKTQGAQSNDVLGRLSVAPPARPAPSRPSRPSRPAAPSRVVVAPAPAPPPPRADSSVVQVFRGDKLSQQKFEKKDSTTFSATP